jgi:hypothetical protein
VVEVGEQILLATVAGVAIAVAEAGLALEATLAMAAEGEGVGDSGADQAALATVEDVGLAVEADAAAAGVARSAGRKACATVCLVGGQVRFTAVIEVVVAVLEVEPTDTAPAFASFIFQANVTIEAVAPTTVGRVDERVDTQGIASELPAGARDLAFSLYAHLAAATGCVTGSAVESVSQWIDAGRVAIELTTRTLDGTGP